MCRLYQSFLFQIWGRITDHDKRQVFNFLSLFFNSNFTKNFLLMLFFFSLMIFRKSHQKKNQNRKEKHPKGFFHSFSFLSFSNDLLLFFFIEEKIDENWGIKSFMFIHFDFIFLLLSFYLFSHSLPYFFRQAAPLSIVLQNPLVSDLHQLFLETSEKGFQLPIEMVQSFVDNCISTSEIYTFLFALDPIL